MESPKKERLRFRDLRSKTLAFKKRNAIAFCDLKTSLGARACVQVLCVQKTRRFAFAFLSPLRFCRKSTTGYVGSGLPQSPFLENNRFPLKVGF